MEKRFTVVVAITFFFVIVATTYPALNRLRIELRKRHAVSVSKLDKSKTYEILGKDANGNFIIREKKNLKSKE